MPKRRKTAKRPRARVQRPRKDGTQAIEAALAALAHDIRTPLTGILAHAELLAASDLGARERGWALGVKSAAEHLAQLTTIVCDAVRADAKGLPLRQESFSPRLLADELAESLSARAQMSGLASQIDVAADLPERIIGDPVRLRAAVENLIDNAVKFTARGTVALRVSASGRGRTRLVFAVSDSGIGLTPAEIKKLFRPFAQASEEVSRRYGGTGLGLMLVRRLARAMGGDLAVSSRAGKGSTFTLHVIAEIENGKPGKGSKARSLVFRGGEKRPRRVLCVEDSPYGRVVINTILRELGDRVDFVPSGSAALEALKRAAYDLVLMDVMLNDGADGFAITRQIRALPTPASEVPVIGISARNNGEAQAREAGMNAYLTKPISPATLADAIKTVVIER